MKATLFILGAVLIVLSANRPNDAYAGNFYECTHISTGEKRFTDGGLPSSDWKCKGFGMERGGFTKIAPPRGGNSGGSNTSSPKKGKLPANSAFGQLIKKSWGGNSR